jgi:hypothetical protein
MKNDSIICFIVMLKSTNHEFGVGSLVFKGLIK